MTDVVPDGYTTLPEAVRRLAADLPNQTVALKANQERLASELGFPDDVEISDKAATEVSFLTWAKRQIAVWKMHEALRNDTPVSFARDPVSGAIFRITADDWFGATLWRDTIIGGEILARPGELIERYAGRLVLVETAAAEAWLARAMTNECLSWLIEEMRGSFKVRPQTKASYRDKAKERYGVSGREFDRQWAAAIVDTGAVAWGHAGRPK